MRTYNDLLALADAAEIIRPSVNDNQTTAAADAAGFALTDTVLENCFSNAETVISEDRDENKPETIPRPMMEIIADLQERTNDELHQVSGSLFAHSPGSKDIDWLKNTSAAIGWIQSKFGVIQWHRGIGFVSKEEFFSELQRTAHKCLAIETLPHVPPIPGHYYTCHTPAAGDGQALDGLIEMHALETDLDKELMLALYCTAITGIPPGTRPAFLITSPGGRGKGKSKFCQHLARVFGGMIDISPNEDFNVVKQRLLSPDAINKRVASLDNVKSWRFSDSNLESVITCSEINGKKLYVGDASRPNTLIWVITLNGAALSTDMAQRVIEIQLRDPDYSSDWEERVQNYIDANRQAIIADCVAFLQQPAKPMKRHSRWATWESQVLSKTLHPDDCLDLILSRRSEADTEEEEAVTLEDFIGGRLHWLEYDLELDDVFIPNEILARWFNEATGEKFRVTGVSRKIKQLRDEGRLSNLLPHRLSGSGRRGARWAGKDAELKDSPKRDLMERLAKKMAEKIENKKQETENQTF